MTSRLVPTAALMRSPTTFTRAGTARNPPPTPRTPVTAPSPAPVRATRPVRTGASSGRTAAGGRSIRTAARAATTAKAPVSTPDGSCPDTAPPIAAGTSPAAANRAPSRQRTAPPRAWVTSAVTEVRVTTTSPAVVAAAGLNPSR